MARILILGAGAIGSNLASNLLTDLKGEHEITILDMDTVEERNITAGTQLYTREQLGLPKVEALQYNLYKWHEREVNIKNERFGGTIENWDQYDLTIDCFDNQEARALVQLYYTIGKDLHTPPNVLHVGFSDQFTFAIEWAENYKVPSDILSGFDICEMEGASSFVKMVAAVASLVAQDFIYDNSCKKEFIGNRLQLTKVS